MTRRKKLIFVIIVIIAIVAAVKLTLYVRERKAIHIAQEYLMQKYEFKTRYESIRFSFINPSLYYVRFSPINRPELIFEVLVQNDLTIFEYGEGLSPDNYYVAYFEYLMRNYFSADVHHLWDNTTKVAAMQVNVGLYAFIIPSEFNEGMTLEEMEPLFGDYWIYVITNTMVDSSSMKNEASKIFELIQIVQNSKFTPKCISYYCLTENPIMKNGYSALMFKNWSDIFSVEQVIEKMEVDLVK